MTSRQLTIHNPPACTYTTHACLHHPHTRKVHKRWHNLHLWGHKTCWSSDRMRSGVCAHVWLCMYVCVLKLVGGCVGKWVTYMHTHAQLTHSTTQAQAHTHTYPMYPMPCTMTAICMFHQWNSMLHPHTPTYPHTTPTLVGTTMARCTRHQWSST